MKTGILVFRICKQSKLLISIKLNLLNSSPFNLLGGFLHLCFQTCDILCVLKYRVSIDRVIEYEFHRSRSYRTACKGI